MDPTDPVIAIGDNYIFLDYDEKTKIFELNTIKPHNITHIYSILLKKN
jgi:hypothetical protein